MRAVTIGDGRLRWEVRPDPEPSGAELLVRVRAAGVNPADLLQLQGHYPAPPGSPADIPGMELSGEVVAVGPRVLSHRPGDRVMALVGGGAQAELAVFDEGLAMDVPRGIPWEQAAGFCEVYCTAFDALVSQANLGLGDRVLITGAAGGVGSAAVQLATTAGARVVASVRRQALRPALESLGAERALDPESAVAAGPFDVVLELVGGPSLAEAVPALAPGGRIVVIGVGGGRTVDLDLSALMSRRAVLRASTLRARALPEKAAVVRAVERRVVPLLASGRCTVPVAATYPMESAEDGYRRVAEGGNLGKVVLAAPS